jgi:SprT-like family
MRALWGLAVVLAVGILIAGFLGRSRSGSGVGPAPARPPVQQPAAAAPPAAAPAAVDAPRPPGAADEEKTQELLRANTGLESDPALAAESRAIDERYFSRGLPEIHIRWEPRLEEVGQLIADRFRLEGVTDGHLILLNPAVKSDPRELRRALCHEIVHVAVWNQDRGHGAVFQRFLHDLASQGAFEGLVATDEEKQAMRSTIDERSAALKAAADALVKARAEIDAADAGVRAYRAPTYNTRVQEYNAAVAEFNRLVEQYNLMIVYPDGLDRERAVGRAAFADTRR